MKIVNLNHVSLEVIDVDATIRFYEDVVGLRQIARPAFGFPGAWFRIGDYQELHLIGGNKQRVSSSSRGDHFAVTVETIESAMEQLKSKGVSFTGPHNRPDGAKQIFCNDPDGHVVEFCTVPAK